MSEQKKLKEQYSTAGLDKESVDSDPTAQFKIWFKQACDAKIDEPNAMMLATLSAMPAPTQRTVLMKEFDQDGFVFFTNHHSRKGRDMAKNTSVSAVFPWYALHRQVIIEGVVERISEKESLAYFHSRPRAAQLGAWASQQSKVLESREVLEERLQHVTKEFADQDVPLPDFWGGYRICPHRFEFWQGREHRLHDRIVYMRHAQANWEITRLSP